MSWFSKIGNFMNQGYSLGKNAMNNVRKTIGKVNHYSNQANKFINSTGVKNLVKSVSHYVPEINNVYSDVKNISRDINNFTTKAKQVIQPSKRYDKLQNENQNQNQKQVKQQTMERHKPNNDSLGLDLLF